MKITTFKCDRCGIVAENGSRAEWGTARLTTPAAVFVADLCPACSSQIKGDVTFVMQKRTGRKTS